MEEREFQQQQEEVYRPTVYPSLVIGCGGTGVKALRRLRRRLKDEFGRRVDEEPPLIQMLGVDTVPLTNVTSMEALHQHEYAYIGGFNASRVIENLERFEEIAAWWDYDTERGLPLGFISTGARQLRVIGRLAFFRRFHTYNSRLKAKLGQLPSIRSHQETHAGERGRPTQDQVNLPLIFVIASLAGGTGSGVFLDIGNHLRAQYSDQVRIIAILVMPSVFERDIPSLLQQRRIKANTYAALKELDYFQAGGDFQTKYPTEPAIRVRGRAFDFVYLLDRQNREGFTLDTQEDIQQAIADFIFLATVSPMAGELWESDVNITQEHALSQSSNGAGPTEQPKLRALAYSTLGVSRLEVDERKRFQDYLGRYARGLRAAVIGQSQAGVSTEVEAVKQQIADWAALHSGGVGQDAEVITTQYKERMEADVRRIIYDKIRDHLPQWGLAGARDFASKLHAHYITYLDASANTPESEGQKTQRQLEDDIYYAEEDLKKVGTSLGRQIIDFVTFHRRNPEDEEREREDIERDIDELTRELETHLMIRRGVAPDARVQLETVLKDLDDRQRWLQGVDLSLEPLPSMEEYPLLTYVEHGNGEGVEDDLDREGIANIAGGFLRSWYSVSLGERIRVELSRMTAEDARKQIMREAYSLTDAYTRTHSSLEKALRNVADQSVREYDQVLRDFIRRCVPYCRMDFDRWSFSEQNIEETNLLVLPPTLQELFNTTKQGRFVAQLNTGNISFRTTRASGHDFRIDAAALAHGYPIAFFADLPEMYVQYMSDDLGASPLHLRCAWRKLPNIHFPFTGEPAASDFLLERLAELCPEKAKPAPTAVAPDAASSPGGAATNRPQPAPQTQVDDDDL